MELYRSHNFAMTFKFLFCDPARVCSHAGLRVPLPKAWGAGGGQGGGVAVKCNGKMQIKQDSLFSFILFAPAPTSKNISPPSKKLICHLCGHCTTQRLQT
jgi:hypothetical protein